MLLALLKIARRLGLLNVLVSVDDNLGKKDKATCHLETVNFCTITTIAWQKTAHVNWFIYVAAHI